MATYGIIPHRLMPGFATDIVAVFSGIDLSDDVHTHTKDDP